MSRVNLETFADGGAWKNAAMKGIKEYLEFELNEAAGETSFTVIS